MPANTMLAHSFLIAWDIGGISNEMMEPENCFLADLFMFLFLF